MRKIEHIREKILKAYTFPAFEDETNKELAERLKTSNAASCHIRRGDYLKEPAMCVHAILLCSHNKNDERICKSRTICYL